MLGLYWLYILRKENSMPKATTEVLRVQGNSLKKEYRERKAAEKNSVTGKSAAANAAKAARPAPGNARRAKASAVTGKKKLLSRAVGRISKKARLF